MTPEFKKQYESPEWQKVRLKVFNRDKWMCKRCKSKEKQLSVHHLYYNSKIKVWEYPMGCYYTACPECHLIIKQEQRIYEQALITSLYDLNFVPDDILHLVWVLTKDGQVEARNCINQLLKIYPRR